MPIIVEKPGKKNECTITLPTGRVERIQVNTGNYHWMLDLEVGKLDMLSLPLHIDKAGAAEIRKAMLQFEEYLTNEKPEEPCEECDRSL